MIDTWEAWVAQIEDDPRHERAADLAARLAPGARVLELGCGGGTQETRELALLTALGTLDEEAWTGEFLGAPSFFSSFPPATNSALVATAGFTIERDDVVEIREPEGPARFQWILGRA